MKHKGYLYYLRAGEWHEKQVERVQQRRHSAKRTHSPRAQLPAIR